MSRGRGDQPWPCLAGHHDRGLQVDIVVAALYLALDRRVRISTVGPDPRLESLRNIFLLVPERLVVGGVQVKRSDGVEPPAFTLRAGIHFAEGLDERADPIHLRLGDEVLVLVAKEGDRVMHVLARPAVG